MTYELVGVFPSEKYFKVEPKTGIVRVISNLKNDPLQLLAYTVRSLKKFLMIHS